MVGLWMDWAGGKRRVLEDEGLGRDGKKRNIEVESTVKDYHYSPTKG